MKKIICILISIIISLSFTGCRGSKQEVEKLAVVMAIGFDLTPENKYLVTVQILNAQKESSKGDQGSSSPQVMIFSSEGYTPYDAISNLSTKYGRDLYFGHSQYIVIGKHLAESGLSLFIDSALRSHQTRAGDILLLAKDKASEVVAFKPIDETIPSNSVKNLTKLQSFKGYSPIISRLDFANALYSKTSSPIMGVIDINQSSNISPTLKLDGTGVFRKDKLIGHLNIKETRGMQWIKGKVKNGTITTSLPNGKKITFYILGATSKVKSIIENNNIIIKVNIKSQSSILELDDKLDTMKHPKIMDDLGKLQSEAIEREVNLALNASQKKFDADIFDFGSLIHRDYPKEWKSLEGNWNNIFPHIKVEVTVTSNLKNPGTISKSIDSSIK
ncbi:spore germination protein KC [Clostridium algifaecis]|uniref:Spore germination protein KC n=1 Tax=Clostridium algifaecis TaxID=1472040 RepID=A0ABS4KUB7_9CLOT|nr:Ger(x)C family spore germination protein [Clostridium algifaecis]MBP2032961.1 spore germination protein KC [Clostridium algifaecis]